MTRRLSTACLSLLLLPALAAAQTASVTVRRPGSGERETFQNVRITSDGLTGVEARKGPQRFTWDPDEILEVSYRGAPEAYSKGLKAFQDGNFETAAAQMQAVLDDGRGESWVPAYANWYLARSLQRLGDLEGADSAYQNLIQVAPRSRFVPSAYQALARNAMARGETGAGAARRHYQSLRDLAEEADLPDRFKQMAQLGLATVTARFGSTSKGVQELRSVLQEAEGRYPDLANRARLEIGRTYIRQGNFKEAETFFKRIQDQLSQDDPDPMLVAGASNGLGDSQRQQGRFMEAARSYSKVYALFLDRSDLRGQVAHALYWGGYCFDQAAASKDITSADKRSKLRRRAKILWWRAAREFQGTRGSQLARERLGT